MGLLQTLGLPPRRAAHAAGASTLALWRDARERAGAQLAGLQGALRATGDAMLAEIADKGLAALTQRLQVGLHVALAEFDGTPAARRDAPRAKARSAVEAMRGFLQAHPGLPLLDGNPFGVEVTMQRDLAVAMDAIDAALAA